MRSPVTAAARPGRHCAVGYLSLSVTEALAACIWLYASSAPPLTNCTESGVTQYLLPADLKDHLTFDTRRHACSASPCCCHSSLCTAKGVPPEDSWLLTPVVARSATLRVTTFIPCTIASVHEMREVLKRWTSVLSAKVQGRGHVARTGDVSACDRGAADRSGMTMLADYKALVALWHGGALGREDHGSRAANQASVCLHQSTRLGVNCTSIGKSPFDVSS